MFGSPRTWKQFIQTLWCHNVYGKGHTSGAEMPAHLHPSQPVTGGQLRYAEMPSRARPPPVLEPFEPCNNAEIETLQGEGFNIQTHVMSTTCQSFPNNLQGVKSQAQKCQSASAPAKFLGQRKNAEMSFHTCPREGSPCPCRNAKPFAPFPTS